MGSPTPASAGEPAPGDERALRRIRGLLAKAESTEFPEEAESLTGKAQELMTRHAVDAALLGHRTASGRRRGDEGGYTWPTRTSARRCSCWQRSPRPTTSPWSTWYQSLGIANLVGGRPDLDAVELLFTSLLLQVAQGLAAAERQAGRRSATRTFRRAFLLGYAQRTGRGWRPPAAAPPPRRQPSAEVDLLPTLRSRREAVDSALAGLFPQVRTSRNRSSVDAGGWYAGRALAERADVGQHRSSLR